MATTRFQADISKFVEKAQGQVETVIKKVALDLFSDIVIATPVDTGRARGNWYVSLGASIIKKPDESKKDKTGASTIAQITNDLQSYTLRVTDIYFTNNLPYATALENGHSKQAPHGMVNMALQNFQSYVQRVVLEEKK